MDTMAAKKSRPELMCIICSGGGMDANGAHTVCALCEIQGLATPGTEDLAAAA